MMTTTPAPQRPSWSYAIAALIVPLIYGPVTAASLVFVSSNRLAVDFTAAGAPIYGVFAAMFLGAVLIAALCAASARGVPVPPAVIVAVSLLPWVIGIAGSRLGVTMVAEAIANVNPADKATIVLAGMSEAAVNAVFGAWATAGLAAGAAAGLGIAALGIGERRWSLAGAGAVALVAAGGVVGVATASARSPAAVGVPLVAVLIGVVCGCAGAASKPGATRAIGAICAAAVSLIACSEALARASIRSVLEAAANVADADRRVLIDTFAELLPAQLVATALIVGSAVTLFAVVAFAARTHVGALVVSATAAAAVIGFAALSPKLADDAHAAPFANLTFSSEVKKNLVTFASGRSEQVLPSLHLTGTTLEIDGYAYVLDKDRDVEAASSMLLDQMKKYADLYAMAGAYESVPSPAVALAEPVSAAALSKVFEIARDAGAHELLLVGDAPITVDTSKLPASIPAFVVTSAAPNSHLRLGFASNDHPASLQIIASKSALQVSEAGTALLTVPMDGPLPPDSGNKLGRATWNISGMDRGALLNAVDRLNLAGITPVLCEDDRCEPVAANPRVDQGPDLGPRDDYADD